MVEIARQIFLSLNREGNMYYILNDQNFVTKFYAVSEMRAKELFTAYCKGDYRERYAIENCTRTVTTGDFIKFLLTNTDPLQDANGATYSISRKEWVN